MITGVAKTTHHSGWTYHGEFVEGKRLGQGKLWLADGTYYEFYEGKFTADKHLKLSGTGIIISKDKVK